MSDRLSLALLRVGCGSSSRLLSSGLRFPHLENEGVGGGVWVTGAHRIQHLEEGGLLGGGLWRGSPPLLSAGLGDEPALQRREWCGLSRERPAGPPCSLGWGGGREALPCCLCTCPQSSLRLQPGAVLEMTYY